MRPGAKRAGERAKLNMIIKNTNNNNVRWRAQRPSKIQVHHSPAPNRFRGQSRPALPPTGRLAGWLAGKLTSGPGESAARLASGAESLKANANQCKLKLGQARRERGRGAKLHKFRAARVTAGPFGANRFSQVVREPGPKQAEPGGREHELGSGHLREWPSERANVCAARAPGPHRAQAKVGRPPGWKLLLN